jgi:branched-subunit amino acid permease
LKTGVGMIYTCILKVSIPVHVTIYPMAVSSLISSVYPDKRQYSKLSDQKLLTNPFIFTKSENLKFYIGVMLNSLLKILGVFHNLPLVFVAV